jgi:hypothetical protein
MTRLVAILVTLFLVAIPAKADVALWPPVQGWTVIKVYGEIKQGDLATFQRYTENVDPAATLVIVTGPGGNLAAGIGMGIRIHQKKLIVGVMGMCTSSCALIWIGGETGRKFYYQDRPGVLTFLCFHQASQKTLRPDGVTLPAPSGPRGLHEKSSANLRRRNSSAVLQASSQRGLIMTPVSIAGDFSSNDRVILSNPYPKESSHSLRDVS